MSEEEHKTGEFHETFNPFDLANGAANKLDPPAGFDGPVRTRRVTDPLCLIILLATWGVTIWIGVWSIQNGDIDVLVHPADYKGRLCGVDKDSSGQVLPAFWHPVDTVSNGICVDECPSQSNLEPASIDDLVCKENDDLLAIVGCSSDGTVSNDPSVLVTCGGCMYEIGSHSLNGHCTPMSITPIISKVNGEAEAQGLDTSETFQNFENRFYIKTLMRDLRTSFPIVSGVGFGGSIFLGLICLVLFRFSCCIAPLIWISAGLVPLVLGGAGTLLFFLANDYELDQTGLHSNFKVLVVKVLAYGTWALSGIMLFVVVIMKTQIRHAISISKAASFAIKEVTFVFTVAIAQTFAFTLLVGSLAFWMLMLASSKTFTMESSNMFGYEISHISQSYSVLANYMFWFTIFVAIWTSEFIAALGKLTLSLCISKWFYTPEKEDGNAVSVTANIGTTLIKHAGTAASGSLLIKPICLCRSPVLLIQSCIKRSGADNTCMDAIICCCQCYLFVLERFLKFASKMAYHHTSIFGSSFCKGSHESHYLKCRNEEFLEEAGSVPFFSVFFCKVLITSSVSLASFAMLDMFYEDAIHNIVSVTFVIAVLSWFIAEFFTDVLGETVSTLLYCYIADEEIMGLEGSPFVTPELYEFLDQINESSDLAATGIEYTGDGVEVGIPHKIDVNYT